MRIEDCLLSKSIVKRRRWMKQYNLSERSIFELFSEFTSMMMVANVEEFNE